MMKARIMLLTGLLLSLLSKGVHAQIPIRNDWVKVGDTLIIQLADHEQVIITAPNFSLYPDNPDSLIRLLAKDMLTGTMSDTSLSQSKEVHYMIAVDGRRRMRFSNNIEESFDFNREYYRFEQQLPAYVYHIYYKQAIISLYLNDPEQLQKISRMDLTIAALNATKDKRTMKRQKQVIVNQLSNGEWKTDTRKLTAVHSLNLGASFGMYVFPGHMGPSMGVTLFYRYRNSYRQPLNAIGYSFEYIYIKDYKDANAFQVAYNQGMQHFWHRLYFLHRVGDMTVGVNYGYIQDNTLYEYKVYGITTGVSIQINRITYSLDLAGLSRYNAQVYPSSAFGIKLMF